MKLDVNVLRYLGRDDFRTLTAVEMGQKNVSPGATRVVREGSNDPGRGSRRQGSPPDTRMPAPRQSPDSSPAARPSCSTSWCRLSWWTASPASSEPYNPRKPQRP